MERKTKYKLAAAGTGLALVIGGASYATAAGNNSANGGKNPFSRAIDSLVGKGTLTQNQADALNKELNNQQVADQAARDAERVAREKVITDTLGIDAATLQSKIQAGNSLAQIAGDKKDALIAALVKLETSEIDARLAAGQITADQATADKANVATRVADVVNNTGGMMRGPGRGHGGMMGGPRGGFGVAPQHQATVAKVLGLDTATIQSRLQAGETLAQIAGTKTEALIAALVTEENAEIDARVQSGQLTAAQATTEKANVKQRVTDQVNGVGGPRGGGMMGGPRGEGMGRGHHGGFGDNDGDFGGRDGGRDGGRMGGQNGGGMMGGLTNKATGQSSTGSTTQNNA